MNNSKNVFGTVCNAGVDYLAFTMALDNIDVAKLLPWFELMQAEAVMSGEKRETTNAQGYEGWRTEHLMYGVRHDGYWFRASGAKANDVAEELLVMKARIKPTRVDVQVTLLADGKWERFAAAMRTMVRSYERRYGNSKRSAINLIETQGKGDTCYIGSRKSNRQFRGYDKTAEQKGRIEGQQYRLEVQLTQQQARAIWQDFYRGGDLRELAKTYVGGYLVKRGMYKPWREEGPDLRLPSSYDPTNDERRLNWFETQVIPAWWKMENQEFKARILQQMGLPPDTVIPDTKPPL